MTPPPVRASGSATPPTVRWTAWLLVLYGVVVLANATALQTLGGWAAVTEYPRALVRVVGVAVLAWGLLRGLRWAWWFAVFLVALWLVFGVLGLGVVAIAQQRTGTAVPRPPYFGLTTTVSFLLLGSAFVLLVLPRTRAAFRS